MALYNWVQGTITAVMKIYIWQYAYTKYEKCCTDNSYSPLILCCTQPIYSINHNLFYVNYAWNSFAYKIQLEWHCL